MKKTINTFNEAFDDFNVMQNYIQQLELIKQEVLNLPDDIGSEGILATLLIKPLLKVADILGGVFLFTNTNILSWLKDNKISELQAYYDSHRASVLYVQNLPASKLAQTKIFKPTYMTTTYTKAVNVLSQIDAIALEDLHIVNKVRDATDDILSATANSKIDIPSANGINGPCQKAKKLLTSAYELKLDTKNYHKSLEFPFSKLFNSVKDLKVVTNILLKINYLKHTQKINDYNNTVSLINDVIEAAKSDNIKVSKEVLLNYANLAQATAMYFEILGLIIYAQSSTEHSIVSTYDNILSIWSPAMQ